MYGAGKERKLLEVKVNSFLGRFRTKIQRVNQEYAVHQRDIIDVDAKQNDKVNKAGEYTLPKLMSKFSLNSLAFWMGVGTARNALCDFYLDEQRRGFEGLTSEEPLATIGYQIEFDETGQILRLRNEQVSRATLLVTDPTGQRTNCKFVHFSVVNPPAVLQRKTAASLWKGIEETQPVSPMSRKMWYAILDVVFATRPDVPVLSRWLTCAATSRWVMLTSGFHGLLGRAWRRIFPSDASDVKEASFAASIA
ncbi:unnamed protein product [Symbiodinium microadriaticum]|nr:unnamed protein product [Symbiodinium microadriaticum]CAE7946547.1 unnamed protein product [Symbiodinium sp. KB8]